MESRNARYFSRLLWIYNDSSNLYVYPQIFMEGMALLAKVKLTHETQERA
jgi:hypothetical protein